MRAYVINRDQDRQRLDFVTGSAAAHGGYDLVRIPAVDGRADDFDVDAALPAAWSFRHPTPVQTANRTKIAVFLSHARCWEAIAGGDDPFALVLEDDAELQRAPDDLTAQLQALGDFDIVFVNRRLWKYRNLVPDYLPGAPFVPVAGMQAELASTLPEGQFEKSRIRGQGALPSWPGGEGYVLSRKGARRLMDIAGAAAQFWHADNFLYSACLPATSLAPDVPCPAVFRQIATTLNLDPPLNGHILCDPLVIHADREVGGTVRGEIAKPVPVRMPKAGRVVFHLGPPKTGSTFIQTRVRRNRGMSRLRPTLVVRPDKRLAGLRNAAGALHDAIGNGQTKVDTERAAFRAEAAKLATELTAGGLNLVSDEELAGRMPGRNDVFGLYPALVEICTMLSEAVAPMESHFVFYDRNFPRYVRSVYNQAVKTDRSTLTYDEYVAALPADARLSDSFAAVARALGPDRVTVVSMEQELKLDTGLGTAVLEMMGIDPARTRPVPDQGRNESLNYGALEFLRELNGVGLPLASLRALRAKIQDRQDLFVAADAVKTK